MPERFKAVERSCRLFRRLLAVYPKAHREEYGDAILQLFRDQCRDAWTANRTRGLIVFWLGALTDLLKTSVLEHLANVNQRKFMFNLFRSRPKLLIVFCSVFTAVFLLTLGGSIVITLLYPKTYASTARVLVRYVVQTSTNHFPIFSFPRFPQSEIEIISSDAVLNKASEDLGLRKLWSKKYNNGQALDESVVEQLIKSRLEISTARNSDVINIRVFSDSPDEAAKLANGVVKAYLWYRSAELMQNWTAPVNRRISVISTAVPEPKPVRPNPPLNIFLGAMIGVLMGSLSGAVAVAAMWFLGRRPGNTGNPSRSASSDILA